MKKESGEPKFSTKTPAGAEPAFKELFVDGVKDIYWAENHLVKNLPKMQQAASSKKLAAAIESHLQETKTHVTRLEQVFELLGEKVQAQKCDAMEGLAKEGEAIIESTQAGTTARDLGIIMASQKVEHYEIATYGGLTKLAQNLGLADVADILSQTLEEEKTADDKLAGLAETEVNYQVA
ncbi:ferritin-like domain-containing protein [Mucilaginibacter pallidiroseus]|uniref:Ferritin-like domain-containing protein n=1 Tax=Mucilaginibacter pallidiroseus TaxID=2599295 RepID=A0A563UIW3_9SPHI|nr:ferritin-like domain-containing protein [Mucilaginibacter pallidiroseus]TWR31208.1 ferritin-like domain-containing protein [Mucilaginibacter pallidiroseus]